MTETDRSESAGRDARRDRGVRHGVIASIVVNGITSSAALVTIAIMARALRPAELGLVLAMVQVWMLVLLATELGIGPVLSARIAAAFGRDDPADMRLQCEIALTVLTGVAVIVVVGGSAMALVLPWAGWLGGGTLNGSTVAPAVLVTFVTAGLTLPGIVGPAVLGGMQHQAKAQARLAMCSLAGIAGCAVAGWAGAGPWAFVLAFLGPQVATGLIYTWLVLWVEYPHLRPRRARPAIHQLRGFLGASGAMGLIRVSDVVINGSGVIVVAVVLGPAPAAAYGVASRICMAVASVVQTAGSMIWPALTEAIARGDMAWAHSRYRRSVALVAGASVAGGLILCAAGPVVARVLAGQRVQPPFLLFVALAVVVVVFCLNVQLATVVGASQIYRPIAVAFLRGAPVALVLSVLLTRTLGVEGPAIAAAVAYAAIVTPQIYRLARRTVRDLVDHANSSGMVLGGSASAP